MAKTKTKKQEVAVKDDIPEVPAKKKHHVGLIILCVFLTVFIVLPLGFFFGFIFDTSTKDVKATGELDTSKVMNNIMTNAMKDVKTNKMIEIKLGEEQFDEVLMATAKKINVPDYIPKMYSIINENHYTFCVDLQVSFIKSRVAIATTIEEVTKNGDDDEIVFNVDSINIGRCGFLTDLIFNIGSRFINDERLEKAVSDYGFRVDFDLANKKIHYKEKDFREDLDTILCKALGEENMFNSIISYAVSDDRLFDVNFTNGINACFDLRELSEGESTTKIDCDGHAAIIKALYDNGTITNDEEAQYVWNYLIKGHNYYNEEKGNCPEWKFVSEHREAIEAHIGKLEDYLGDEEFEGDTEPVDDLNEEFKERIEGEGTIEPELLYDYAKSQDIIGHASFIDNVDDAGSHTVNYFCMDNFNFEFKDDGQLDIVANLNVNGCPTTFRILTKLATYNNDNIAKYEIDKIFAGKIEIKDSNVRNNLMSIIRKNIQEGSPFELTEDNSAFKFDFSSAIADTGKTITNITSDSSGIHLALQN